MESFSDLKATIIKLTQELNQSILDSNFDRYKELTSPDLTCFEPEGDGHLLFGLDFHEFYYKQWDTLKEVSKMKKNLSILSPNVRLLAGDKVAIIAYIKIIQTYDEKNESFKSMSWEESRVWNKNEKGDWIHVHVHRSVSKKN